MRTNVVKMEDYGYQKEAANYQKRAAKKEMLRRRKIRKYASFVNKIANVFFLLGCLEIVGTGSYIEGNTNVVLNVLLGLTLVAVLFGIGILLKIVRNELMER